MGYNNSNIATNLQDQEMPIVPPHPAKIDSAAQTSEETLASSTNKDTDDHKQGGTLMGKSEEYHHRQLPNSPTKEEHCHVHLVGKGYMSSIKQTNSKYTKLLKHAPHRHDDKE